MQALGYGVSRLNRAQVPPGSLEVDTVWQFRIDSLRQQQRVREKKNRSPQPRDANRIDEYRGYLLGIPPEALDRLYAFRERGGTLENLETFRNISGLPDSTIRRLQPYLLFPRPKSGLPARMGGVDLNRATARELEAVRGIGPVLSKRIVKFREALGGYVHESQLLDVYGLDASVAREVIRAFPLGDPPPIRKIALNEATAEELASLVYINRPLAAAIVARRDRQGPYSSLEELLQVPGFPADKIGRIALYLGL
jgi:DNA uptake protein ComE-like DNA-binding protein